MKVSKRKKLENAGWKVGSADEFLELSSDEAAYIEIKLSLSETLKQERVRRKLSQVEFAKMIASSQSRVAKMEAADPTVSIDLLLRSLLTLGVSRSKVAKTLAA
ncbi:MAG: helix-turn-helix domain-containing protein [Pseudomonadales bacterium]|nr:helix-turn-helix domain-containing protein [Pseudomonadales bacterium]